jgi:predicted Zn-dependent peptidase
VRRITSAELRDFVKAKFRPEAMALTVVADVDERILERQAKKLIAKYFPDKFEGTPVAGIRPLAAPLPGMRKFDITKDKHNHEVNAVIGAPAPSLYEEDERLAAILLGNILAGPASNSILNEILRERNGWVYAVENSYTQYADTGIMAICLGCDRANLDKCLASVHKEILKMQTIPLSEARLRAAKKQLLGQLAISSDNGESQCLAMGKSLLAFGHIATPADDRAAIDAVTAADLRDMARRIFAPDVRSRLIYL